MCFVSIISLIKHKENLNILLRINFVVEWSMNNAQIDGVQVKEVGEKEECVMVARWSKLFCNIRGLYSFCFSDVWAQKCGVRLCMRFVQKLYPLK